MIILYAWFALIAFKILRIPPFSEMSWGFVFLFPIIALIVKLLLRVLSFVFYAVLGFTVTWSLAKLVVILLSIN